MDLTYFNQEMQGKYYWRENFLRKETGKNDVKVLMVIMLR